MNYKSLLTKPYAVRKILENRIDIFAKFILKEHIKTEIGKLHQEWYELLESDENIALACPRGHAKSTIFSLVYPLYCILFQKKKLIVIISDTQQQANDLLGSIIEQLETNERIIKIFGKVAGYVPPKAEDKQKWTMSEIVTTTGIKVVARGWKSKLRGIKFGATRPDLVIVDDIENDEAVNSAQQRQKLMSTFKRSILNIGDKQTRYIMVGTILHFDSLLNNIINTPPPNWWIKLYRAIEGDKVLWNEYFTIEELNEKRKQIGSIAFEQEYQNNPLDPSQQIINFKKFFTDLPSGEDYSYDSYGYIDLAISEKETADYTAICTIQRDYKTGIMYVVDMQEFRGSINDQLEKVFELHERFNYVNFGVESVAYQKAFFQLLTSESNKRGIYIPTLEVKIDKDKIRRAKSIVSYIENDTIIVNKNLINFITQAHQFPKSTHDDMVDAFTGAVQLVIDNAESGGFAVAN